VTGPPRSTGYACPRKDCTETRAPDQVLCRRCWFSVPKAIRDTVWREFRKAPGSDAHRQAVVAAIAAADAKAAEKKT